MPGRLGQPVKVMQELTDGIARGVSERLAPPIRIEALSLALRLDLGESSVEIDAGYPWDMSVSMRDNIEGNAEIMLGQVQAELAEATTEPWPLTMGERSVAARGLPQPEPKLVGDVLKLRFRSGPDMVELSPVVIKMVDSSEIKG